MSKRKREIKVDEQTIENIKTVCGRSKREFFNVASYNLANSLLGKILVRKLDDGITLKGRNSETECYPGREDKASVTLRNRTPAKEPLYMQPGTAYVYMTYGMHHCFNISSSEPGGAVLLKALEPLEKVLLGKNQAEQ